MWLWTINSVAEKKIQNINKKRKIMNFGKKIDALIMNT